MSSSSSEPSTRQTLFVQELQTYGEKAQLEMLKNFVENLPRQQVRKLQFLVGNIEFHCDIIEKAPLEVALNIIRHLELYQVFQARRVSKRWAEVFTSRPVLNSSLYPWNIDHESKTECSDKPLEASITSSIAEQIDAYRRGVPFGQGVVRPHGGFRAARNQSAADGYGGTNFARNHSFADGLIAWVYKKSQDCITLRTISNRNDMLVRTPRREEVGKIAVNKYLIAALTTSAGKAYVWSLLNLQSPLMSIQLASAQGSDIAVAEYTVAIFYVNPHAVTIWRKGATKHLIFQMNQWSYWDQYVLDWDGNSLFHFNRHCSVSANGDSGADEVHFCQYNLQGDILAKGCERLHNSPSKGSQLAVSRSNILPRHSPMVWAAVTPQTSGSGLNGYAQNATYLEVQSYDRAHQRLHLTSGLVDLDPGMDARTTSKILCVRGTCYLWLAIREMPRIVVIDLKTFECKDTEICIQFLNSECPEIIPGQVLLGDHNYLINISLTDIRFWCFNRDLVKALDWIDGEWEEKRDSDYKFRIGRRFQEEQALKKKGKWIARYVPA